MKIKEYDTNELLMIANNVTGEYPEKKVRQAKEELYRRGVDDKVIADIMEEKEEAFMKRLDAAARAEKARMEREETTRDAEEVAKANKPAVEYRPLPFEPSPSEMPHSVEEDLIDISFKVTCTRQQLAELKRFLVSNHITYSKV